MRPDTGVQCRMPENRMISNRPHQKIGMEKPVSERLINAWSKVEPRLTPAMMPAGRPMMVAMNSAHSDSSTVAGNRLRNSVRIGWRVTIERPRSPCAKSPR